MLMVSIHASRMGGSRSGLAMAAGRSQEACKYQNRMICKVGLCSATAMEGLTLQTSYKTTSGHEFTIWCFDNGKFVREVMSVHGSAHFSVAELTSSTLFDSETTVYVSVWSPVVLICIRSMTAEIAHTLLQLRG